MKALLILLLAAASAHAQGVSAVHGGNRANLNGGSVSFSVVSASSMTLTGTPGPYDLTTATGIYVGAGFVKMGPGAGIQWSDGVFQTSMTGGGAGGTGIMRQSSTTRMGSFSTTSTADSICFTTVTITTHGSGEIIVSAQAAMTNNSVAHTSLYTLQDGQYVPFADNAVRQFFYYMGAPGSFYSFNLTWRIAAPGAGSHSYCLVASPDTGTLSNNNAVAISQFTVEEWY